MKRFSLAFLLTFFSISSFFALDKNLLSIKITPGISLMNGTINEYVFCSANKNINNMESQLDWDIKNIPVFEFSGDFDFLRYLNINLKASVAIPKRSGNMQDYDWLNSVGGPDGHYPSWKNEDPTELTNYSCHDNFLEKYMTFSVAGGGNIYIPAEIKLTPFIAYYYDFISLNGKEGYKKYKSENLKKTSFSGKVITYKQEINTMLLGLKISVDTLPKMHFDGTFSFSPEKTALNALDYHYINGTNGGTLFWDKFTDLWQINSDIAAQYRFNKYHSIGLTGTIQYIPLSKGQTSYKYLNEDGEISKGQWIPYSTSDTQGGTERLIWSLGINYSFSL